ncbi:MAG: AsmA-like C-terminal region-containing protein [Roseiarcus sp.]|jgi:hypothetical protein
MILTVIAVALVVALSAALFAPFFIDWSRHRAQIEAELGDILGARVVVSGPIDIRFLPTPYLRLKNVTIGDDAAPVFVCDSVQLEVALASLPSGRARFTMARLDRPVLTLSRGPRGSIRLPQWRFEAQADHVALDRIVVTGGRLRIVGGGDGAPLDVAGLDLDAAAGSLIGPYRGSGRVSTPGGLQAEFHFSTAELANFALPLKLEIDPSVSLPGGVFDGAVTFGSREGEAGVVPAYAGAAALSGVAALTESGPPSPWRVSGALHADLGGATLENLVARFGPEERALEASGAAKLETGPSAALSADLQAKQLNVDALLREKGEDSVSPARALAALARVLSPLNAGGGSPLALRIAFAAPTVIVGAQTLSDVALDARAAAGAPIEGDLALGLPGQSTLRLSGALELGSAAGFKGRLEARLGDFAQLRNWATKDEPELAKRLTALGEAAPYRNASAVADVEASAVGFSARNLRLVVDRTALSGAMAFTRPLGEERGRLFMDLRSDALDIDALPNLSASADFFGDIDLSLALDAAKLRVARVGEAALDSGSLSLKVTRTGDELSLDRLSVAGLGGAAVEVRGASGPRGRWLTLQLDAEKLRDFAALIGRVAPGRLSRLLIQRADALSPAKATLEARGSGPGDAGVLALDTVKAKGSAGQTQFTLRVERSGEAAGAVAATFALDAPEASALLQQIGLTAPSASSGRARIEASANGRWESGFDARVAASLAGANFAWRGRVKPDAKADDALLFGAATVKSDNVMPLLATLGLGASVSSPLVPVDLSGDLVLRGGRLGFPRLTGTLAGARLTGQLGWRPAVDPIAAASIDPDVALAQSIAGEPQATPTAQIDGELSLDHASLATLLSLPLGAAQPARPGAIWSDADFAPPLVAPPPLDVALKIGALDVVDGLQARDATARLEMDRGRFDIDEFTMDVAGARASGRLTLRRDGAVATLSGQATLDAAAVDRPGLRGSFDASLAFAGTGQSASALVAGLVGEGRVETVGVAIPRLDPDALGRVLAMAQAPDARIDETNVEHALGAELDRRPMSLSDGAAPAVMTAGVVHVGPRDVAAKGGHASASADFDLRTRNLTIRATFAEAGDGKFWSGPPPSVAVAVAGSLDAPTRQIDAAALTAGLAAQAIARESDRIAALEADIRERAYFNRRLKAEQFMRRRDAELDAYAADQARLKSEQDRKRVEDELLRASEAPAKTAAPAPATPDASPASPQAAGAATIGATVPTPPPAPPNLREIQSDPTAGGLY